MLEWTWGCPVASDASHLDMHWNNDLRGWRQISVGAVCCGLHLLAHLKRKSVGRMVLDSFATHWVLVYTVQRPVCLLISMIGGVCQLPTVLRQRLSRTVI